MKFWRRKRSEGLQKHDAPRAPVGTPWAADEKAPQQEYGLTPRVTYKGPLNPKAEAEARRLGATKDQFVVPPGEAQFKQEQFFLHGDMRQCVWNPKANQWLFYDQEVRTPLACRRDHDEYADHGNGKQLHALASYEFDTVCGAFSSPRPDLQYPILYVTEEQDFDKVNCEDCLRKLKAFYDGAEALTQLLKEQDMTETTQAEEGPVPGYRPDLSRSHADGRECFWIPGVNRWCYFPDGHQTPCLRVHTKVVVTHNDGIQCYALNEFNGHDYEDDFVWHEVESKRRCTRDHLAPETVIRLDVPDRYRQEPAQEAQNSPQETSEAPQWGLTPDGTFRHLSGQECTHYTSKKGDRWLYSDPDEGSLYDCGLRHDHGMTLEKLNLLADIVVKAMSSTMKGHYIGVGRDERLDLAQTIADELDRQNFTAPEDMMRGLVLHYGDVEEVVSALLEASSPMPGIANLDDAARELMQQTVMDQFVTYFFGGNYEKATVAMMRYASLNEEKVGD